MDMVFPGHTVQEIYSEQYLGLTEGRTDKLQTYNSQSVGQQGINDLFFLL